MCSVNEWMNQQVVSTVSVVEVIAIELVVRVMLSAVWSGLSAQNSLAQKQQKGAAD